MFANAWRDKSDKKREYLFDEVMETPGVFQDKYDNIVITFKGITDERTVSLFVPIDSAQKIEKLECDNGPYTMADFGVTIEVRNT